MHKLLKDSAIIIIGNEILSGRTQDTNTKFLAQKLLSIGIIVNEVRIIPDSKEHIIECVNKLRIKYNYVFTSGGIGPTHDDITAECIANAFDVKLPINEVAKKLLQDYYKNQNVELNAARLRMARIPEGANLIDNPISIAPGFQIENVFVLAGVPKIFKAMVKDIIEKLKSAKPIKSKSIRIEKPEGEIAEELASIASDFPNAQIGSYPFKKNLVKGTRIVITHSDILVIDEITKLVKLLK